MNKDEKIQRLIYETNMDMIEASKQHANDSVAAGLTYMSILNQKFREAINYGIELGKSEMKIKSN